MDELNFELNPKILQNIAKGIADGIGLDFINSKKQLDTYTSNSSSTLIWDLINTNCKRALNDDFVCQFVNKKKRGMWEFVVIFDTASKKLITIMRENRLKQILKNPTKYKKHYAAALSRFLNKDLKPIQHKLFNIPRDADDENYLNEISRELCMEITAEALQSSLYSILTFNNSGAIMTSFKAYYLTQNLELSKVVPLQSYIPKDYNIVVNDEPQEIPNNIELHLKEAAINKKRAKDKLKKLVEVKPIKKQTEDGI